MIRRARWSKGLAPFAGTATTVTLAVAALGQQLGVWTEPDSSFKSKVNELAFAQAAPRTSEAALLLRFEPSFHPEFQIAATVAQDGSVLVEYRSARVSSEEAFRRLPPSQRTPEAVVRLMQIKGAPVSVSADVVDAWLRDFWTALETSSSELKQLAVPRRVQLDGTLYSCEYRRGSVTVAFQLSASEVGHESAADPAVVRWMNKIRFVVQERANPGQPHGP